MDGSRLKNFKNLTMPIDDTVTSDYFPSHKKVQSGGHNILGVGNDSDLIYCEIKKAGKPSVLTA